MKKIILPILLSLLSYPSFVYADEDDSVVSNADTSLKSPTTNTGLPPLPSSEVIISGVDQKWRGQGLNTRFLGGNVDVTGLYYSYFILKMNSSYAISNQDGLKITDYPFNVGLGLNKTFSNEWQIQGWGGYSREIVKIGASHFPDSIEQINSDGWFGRTQLRIPFNNRFIPAELKLGGGYTQTSHLYGPNLNAAIVAYFYHGLGISLGYEYDQYKTHDSFIPHKLDSSQIKLGFVIGD